MNARDQKTAGGPENEQARAGRHAHEGDACRCKTTSAMTPRELIKLMIDDLSFWKKKHRGTEEE